MFLEIVALLIFLSILLSYVHSTFQYYLKFTYYFLSVFVSTLVTLPFLCLRPQDVRNARWTYKIHEILTSLFLGVKWEIIGENRLKKNFPCLTVCNHQSSLDILIHSIISWRMSGFIATAKTSVKYIFPVGLNGLLSCVVFIDRSRGKESREMIREAAEKCHDTGATLCLFPEGTRNMKSELLPFKTGAFDAAVKAKLPIVPVVASPYYFLDHKKKKFSSGRVIVSVLPPIPTTHDMDVENLSQEVRNIMNEEYKRLSNLVQFNH